MSREQQRFDRVILIEVDPQVDFTEEGSLPVEGGTAVMAQLNLMKQWVETEAPGGQVLATRDWHPEQTTHFEDWPPHCVQGTDGAEFHPDLDTKGVKIFSKGMGSSEDAFSGFQAEDENGINLAEFVRPVGIEKVALLVGGLATDYCVKATVLDAIALEEPGLTVFAVTDAMEAVAPDTGVEAITQMEQAGAILVELSQIVSGELIAA